MFSKKFLFVAIALIIFSISLFSPASASAQKKDDHPVMTIINPIRGNEWHENKVNLLESLTGQWRAIKNQNINATWLWQYTALEDDSLVNFAKENMKNQEFGLFLELDRNTLGKAGVLYRGQGPLYFSDGSLLTSYDLSERKKIIDTVFAKFKEKFGYYPKTVGAWWIGADSLVYMQKKYGIVAAMKAADQFNLDVYSIWGSPWSIPYLASKENEAIPASTFDEGSKVVIVQWAPRDPLNGYSNAMFSLQDFGINGYDFSYPEYLSTIYLRKPLDNLNIGLENGGTFKQYENYYKDKLSWAKKLESGDRLKIMLVKDYADLFLSKKKIFANSDIKYFLSKDYKSEDQSFWYHSTNFRAAIHKVGDEIFLFDIHDYSKKVKEDFSLVPNSQGYLRVTTPEVIDSMRFPNKKILIAKNKEPLQLSKVDNNLILLSGHKELASFNKDLFKIFPDNNNSKTFNFHEGISRDPEIIFDKKQLFLFSIFPVISFMPFYYSFIIFKISPLFITLIAFYLFFIKASLGWHKPFFSFCLMSAAIFYIRIPYFPLDRSTYFTIAGLYIFIIFIALVVSIYVFKKTKSNKTLFIFLGFIPVVILLITGIIYVSRTSIVLVPFEMDALNFIKEKNKNVIFVSETDYGIKPIYKAKEPFLYENYKFAEKITDSHWEIAKRPENNLIKLSNYENKLIVVPRYLGTDFSDHEAKINNVKKIFDNAQIAIFEKK